jgi:hypothetical protein
MEKNTEEYLAQLLILEMGKLRPEKAEGLPPVTL